MSLSAHSLSALSGSSFDPCPSPLGQEGQGSPFPGQLMPMAPGYHFIFINSFSSHNNCTSIVTILQMSKLRQREVQELLCHRARIQTKPKQPNSRAQAITNSILLMRKWRPQKVEPYALIHTVSSCRARTHICGLGVDTHTPPPRPAVFLCT